MRLRSGPLLEGLAHPDITAAHGGTIAVGDVPGGPGAVFTVRLPTANSGRP